MHEAVKDWLTQCRNKLRTEAITAADLDRLDDLLAEPRQQILYLYAKSTNMRSPLASWALYDAPTSRKRQPCPAMTPPYESVLAAVADGWARGAVSHRQALSVRGPGQRLPRL